MPEARPASSLYLFSPGVDLTLIAGGLTILLVPLAVALPVALGKTAFLVLLFVCNYPHYMATNYRIYRSRAQVERYRFFAVYVTAFFILTALGTHLLPYGALVQGLYALAIVWSPYHYTGQNYGITLLYLRRAGAEVTTRDRRLLYVWCMSVFVMHLVAVLSAGTIPGVHVEIPPEAARAAYWGLLALALASGAMLVPRLLRGPRIPVPALVLMATQFVWWTVLASGQLFSEQPGLAWLGPDRIAPAIAFLHCAQYLGVTTYYARREGAAEGGGFRLLRYAAVVTAGGALLWIGTTRVLSEVFAVDYAQSFMIMFAVINLHHFVMDGAIWKLRDGRLARLLIAPPTAAVAPVRAVAVTPRWRGLAWAAVAVVALVLAGTEVVQSTLLDRAGRLRGEGLATEANALYRAVLAFNRRSVTAIDGLADADLDTGQNQAALARWEESVRLNGNSAASQIGLARTYMRLGRIGEAIPHFERAAALAPDWPPVYAMLAQAYEWHGDRERAQAIRARAQSLVASAERAARTGY